MIMKTKERDLFRKMDAYWRAANYLSVGQIYLYDNPLLKQRLKLEHVKPRLLGHWGTTPAFDRTGERRDNAPEGWKAVLLWLRSLPAETTECDGCDGFSIYDVCVF